MTATTHVIGMEDRRAKAESLRAAGIDPYPHVSLEHRYRVASILAEFAGEHTEGEHTDWRKVAGRITARRKHASATFLDLTDATGTIQLVVREDKLGAAYDAAIDLDIGDIAAAFGAVYTTPRGAIAIMAYNVRLLTKALKAPPSRKGGVTNAETRLRRRELDLLSGSSETFVKRAAIVWALRGWLNDRGYTEIETPALQTLAGGSESQPFTTHYNALHRDLHLSVSPELYLNRCLVGGLEDVYALGKSFRNEGLSRKHSPEFCELEWMETFRSYIDCAATTENLIRDVCKEAIGRTTIQYQGQEIDFAKPWRCVTFCDLIHEHTGCNPIVADDPAEVAPALRLALDLYTRMIEPTLIQPTFVFDFPVEGFPITKRHAENPLLGEHFDAVVGGVEIVSGDTELNDPTEQHQRFIEQRERVTGSHEPAPLDDAYVQALEYGYPPTAGGGMGVDRLVMLLLERESIRDVIPFPMLRSAA